MGFVVIQGLQILQSVAVAFSQGASYVLWIIKVIALIHVKILVFFMVIVRLSKVVTQINVVNVFEINQEKNKI